MVENYVSICQKICYNYSCKLKEVQLMDTKFCEFCGNIVAMDAVICPKCGKQIEELKTEGSKPSSQIIINNNNMTNSGYEKKQCDKWISLLLCIFLGAVGGHKFYERKIGMGILYIFTFGLFGIGLIVDFISLLCKPNPYYV